VQELNDVSGYFVDTILRYVKASVIAQKSQDISSISATASKNKSLLFPGSYTKHLYMPRIKTHLQRILPTIMFVDAKGF
jgi:hypothetical protein